MFLTGPPRGARRRISVCVPDSQRAAKDVYWDSVWKLLLQNVYKLITNNPTGPVCGMWGNRQAHSLTEIQYTRHGGLILSFRQLMRIDSNKYETP